MSSWWWLFILVNYNRRRRRKKSFQVFLAVVRSDEAADDELNSRSRQADDFDRLPTV